MKQAHLAYKGQGLWWRADEAFTQWDRLLAHRLVREGRGYCRLRRGLQRREMKIVKIEIICIVDNHSTGSCWISGLRRTIRPSGDSGGSSIVSLRKVQGSRFRHGGVPGVDMSFQLPGTQRFRDDGAVQEFIWKFRQCLDDFRCVIDDHVAVGRIKLLFQSQKLEHNRRSHSEGRVRLEERARAAACFVNSFQCLASPT